MEQAGISIERVDDALRDYVVWQGEERIGEIRPRALGTSELHLGSDTRLLRRDDTADLAAGGASTLRIGLAMLKLRARYSLRNGDAVLAIARREYSLSTRRDGLSLAPAPGHDERTWSMRALDGAFAGHLVILEREQRIGRVRRHDGWRFTWEGPALDLDRTVFALYALHQQFGHHPSSGN
jgi:hypothetical protein